MLSRMSRDALTVFQAGLRAVDPVGAIKQQVRRTDTLLEVMGQSYDLASYRRVFVIGAGKASAAMAQPMEELLGERLTDGMVNVKLGHGVPLKVVRVQEAGHPVPDEAGLQGTREIMRILEGSDEGDLVICLISGGGSALLPCPAPGLTLHDKRKVTQVLLDCGATIHEINAIRKHLSQVKGGRLARLAYPSTLVSLILSDVIGDDLDSIASGPAVPDPSTFADCLKIISKYEIAGRIPSAALEYLNRGNEGKIEETPKDEDAIFGNTQNLIIASNTLAVAAAEGKAADLGYHTLVLSTRIEGEAREVAKVLVAIAKEILATQRPVERPACVIAGGETTVTIRGPGKGGRNQELALAAAVEIDGLPETVVLSGATDGTDGPTDAAGAIADSGTVMRAADKDMDPNQYLRQNDSYHFFQELGDLLMTGPTRTNVMDLHLVLVG